MVKGIGIDMVEIPRMKTIMEKNAGGAFLRRTFTDAEREAAATMHDPAEYYATRFAAKEAVFKAVAHLTPSGRFDLRIIETLNYEDGAPYVNITERLKPVLEEAGVTRILISITTEGDCAAAYAIACDES